MLSAPLVLFSVFLLLLYIYTSYTLTQYVLQYSVNYNDVQRKKISHEKLIKQISIIIQSVLFIADSQQSVSISPKKK